MAIVTAEESRAGSRDLYVPPHERGMAHRSYPSPDGKSILVVEMNERGAFGPCRLVSAEGNSREGTLGLQSIQHAMICSHFHWHGKSIAALRPQKKSGHIGRIKSERNVFQRTKI